jgi:hypothetical protein
MTIRCIPGFRKKFLHSKRFFGKEEDNQEQHDDNDHKDAVVRTMELGTYGTITNVLVNVKACDVDRVFVLSETKIKRARRLGLKLLHV